MASWLHGFMASWLHGFMASWLHGSQRSAGMCQSGDKTGGTRADTGGVTPTSRATAGKFPRVG